jgi:hypothetical protein
VAASFRPLLLRTLDDWPPDALEIELTYRSVRDSGSTPLHDNVLYHLQFVLAAARDTPRGSAGAGDVEAELLAAERTMVFASRQVCSQGSSAHKTARASRCDVVHREFVPLVRSRAASRSEHTLILVVRGVRYTR